MEKNRQILDQIFQSHILRLNHQKVHTLICQAYGVEHLYQVSLKETRVIVVAAGNGSRFHGAEPKVLAQGKYGRSLLLRVLDVVAPFDFSPVVVVNREIGPFIQSAVAQDMRYTPCWVFQKFQKGTGNAVLAAEAELAHFHGSLIVVWGDMGALSERLVFAAVAIHQLLNAAITLPTKWCNHPYVALIRDSIGRVINVLQEHNGHKMPDYGEQDCGVFIVKSPDVFRWLHDVSSSQPDHTDVDECDFLSLLRSLANTNIYAVCMGAAWECQGVNTLQDLAIADDYAHKIDQQTIKDLAYCQTPSEVLDLLTWTTVQMDLFPEVEKALLRLAVDRHSLFRKLPLRKHSVIEKWLSVLQKGN